MADHPLHRIFEQLRDRQEPPDPWTGEREVPWGDPCFSSDYARAAARDPETTEDEFNFIVSSVGLPIAPKPREMWNILDLGCGDGRLLLPMARLGHRGFGIDVGPGPIDELTRRSGAAGISIEAVVGDLREWTDGDVELGPFGEFDLVLLSFGTLGSLRREDGASLLRRVGEALRPGGWLALDMGLSRGFAEELDERQEWWTAEDFVLGEGPQLVLDDHAFDGNSGVYVRRSFALHLSEPPRLAEVRQTAQLYENDELASLLKECGLRVERECGDFLDAPYDPDSSENLVVMARKNE